MSDNNGGGYILIRTTNPNRLHAALTSVGASVIREREHHHHVVSCMNVAKAIKFLRDRYHGVYVRELNEEGEN